MAAQAFGRCHLLFSVRSDAGSQTALASCRRCELCLMSQLDLAEEEAARAMLSAGLYVSLLQAWQPLLCFFWKLSAGGAGSVSQ